MDQKARILLELKKEEEPITSCYFYWSEFKLA